MGDQASDPIIVFGAPRSGTTYVREVLNQHPDVFITHEVGMFTWAHQTLHVVPNQKMLFQTHRSAFVSHLQAHLRDVIRAFYREQAADRTHWGDKNPFYAEFQGPLETTLELFPRTKFVHVVRDGREVVASLVKKRWTDFPDAHELWIKHVVHGRSFGDVLPEEQYLELRYEDLVADDVLVAEQLFAFLGVDFDPVVRSFCEGQRVDRTPYSEPTHPIASQRSSWAALFTEAEQAESLSLLNEQLARFGYVTPRAGSVDPVTPGAERANSDERTAVSRRTLNQQQAELRKARRDREDLERQLEARLAEVDELTRALERIELAALRAAEETGMGAAPASPGGSARQRIGWIVASVDHAARAYATLREQNDRVAERLERRAAEVEAVTQREQALEVAVRELDGKLSDATAHAYRNAAALDEFSDERPMLVRYARELAASRTWRYGHRLALLARKVTFRRSKRAGAAEVLVAMLEARQLPSPNGGSRTQATATASEPER